MRKRDISHSLPYSEFPAATGTFTGLVVAFVLGLVGISNTYASSISISLTGNVNLNLVKNNTTAVFGTSTAQTATVASDHYTGYTLTIAGANDTGRLVGTNDNTKYLSSIDSPLTESVFSTDDTYNNQWGFLPGTLYINNTKTTNTNYQPSPTTAGTTMDVTNSPNISGTDYTLALGAKVTPAMSLDSYSQTFILAATGNGYDYHIGFTDDLETMPADMYGNTKDDTITLPLTAPTKAGYTFVNWCSEATTNDGTVCPGETYEKGATITLDSKTGNNMDLHAVWSPVTFADAFGSTSMTMQNMTTSICNAVAVGQTTALTDTRSGNKSYTVGKMKDGRCWMLDNLALGGSSTIALKTTDTNITADWTLPASISSGFNSYTVAQINADSIDTVPSDSMSTAGGWKIGVYYNYCAASAGTYCMANGSGIDAPVNSDICPRGWKIPSAGPGGEYQVTYDFYNNNYTDFRTAMHLPLSGSFYSSRPYNPGSRGNWWSSTFQNSVGMYRLYTESTGFNPQSRDDRLYGNSLRCVAK